MTDDTLRFPEGFLWGASTAAHQVEGNNVNNDWWVQEHLPGSRLAEASGDACDSYHRYGEDIALLAELGFNTYRFSIEWSRIEPEQGYVSRAQIEHYRRMVGTCHEYGLTPMVTLLHFTLPRWMAAQGGWKHPQAASLFARFTESSLPILADVQWVCTINEPNMTAVFANGADTQMPTAGLPVPDSQVSDVLVDAHRRCREVLNSIPVVRSGWSVATQAVQAEPGCEQAAHDYGYPREDLFLEAARGDDFVGVQAYTRTMVGPDGPRPVPAEAETTLTGWEYFPPALGIGVRNAWTLSDNVPVIVTENGIATGDDTRRVDYTRGALTSLHEAISDGVEVLGYLHWSALDNYEWGSYAPTFGLIAVDRHTFRRTVKPSARWLGATAKAGAVGSAQTPSGDAASRHSSGVAPDQATLDAPASILQ